MFTLLVLNEKNGLVKDNFPFDYFSFPFAFVKASGKSTPRQFYLQIFHTHLIFLLPHPICKSGVIIYLHANYTQKDLDSIQMTEKVEPKSHKSMEKKHIYLHLGHVELGFCYVILTILRLNIVNSLTCSSTADDSLFFFPLRKN